MTSKNTYFLKEYKLMIHNIILDDELRARYKSKKCAYQKQIKIRDLIAINQVLDISVLDEVNQETQEIDNEVLLDLSNFINGKNYDVATIKFDMTKQKVLAPSSTNFFTKKLENSCQQENFSGTVQYKFVGMKKRQISSQEVIQLQKTKKEVQIKDQLLNQHQELKRMADILQERNSVIMDQLSTNKDLIMQLKRVNEQKIKERQQGRSGSKGKDRISFNVNVNATAHEKMINENKALIDQNYNLKADIDKLQLDVQALQAQVKYYKEESNLYKKQLQRKQGQPSIFINQPAYRLQTAQNQQRQLENKSKMADSIYEGGPNINTPRNNQRRRKTSFNRNSSQQLLDLNQQQQYRRARTHTIADLSKLNMLQPSQSLAVEIENLKSSIQKQDPNRVSKLQINLKNGYKIIERLSGDKQLLQNTISIKNQEVLQLKSEINKQLLQIKSLQKVIREKTTTAKHEYDQRTTAIRLQAQMKMLQLRRNKKFQNYENIQKQQKLQLMFQNLKYEVQTAKQQNALLKAQIQSLKAQKQSLQNTYNTTQISIKKEKQMYKSKYHEISESFVKKQQQLSTVKDKAAQYETHLERIHQLQALYEQLQKKNQKQTKQKQDFQRTAKRYQDKLQAIQQDYNNFKKLQVDYDSMNRKYQSIQKINQKFDAHLLQLRKFATKLQNTYYQKRQKQQSQKEFNNRYNQEMEKRLEEIYKKMNKFERQFYEEMMDHLALDRKECIQNCFEKIKRQSEIIDQSDKIQEKKKTLTKSDLEKSLNKEKDHKLQEIEKKIKHYQALYKKVQQEQGYVPKALSQKVSYLQQKMRSFQLGQMGYISKQASLKLKQTIQKLTQSLKSKQIQCDQLKKSVGKRSYLDSSLYGGNYLQPNQRKVMIQEMTKSRQIYTRSFEDMKRHNSELMKQKSMLEIQVQNSKFREQKLILKHQERQRQLQRVAKKSNDQNNKKISDLTRNLEKRSDEVIKLNHQRQELKENLNNCIGELNSLGQILQKMQKENLSLQDQNQEQRTRLQKYQQAQKILLKQVQTIKSQAEFNEKQFRVLLQERNEAFLKIQKIKDTQIDKLKKVIEQCQFKLQQQISQVLTLKRQQQKNTQTINTLSSQLQESKTNCEVTSENLHKEVQETILQINTLENQNDQLQTNLIEYAQKLRQAQFELAESQIKLDSFKMQVQALQSLKVQMKQLQSKFTKQKKGYLQIIEQQTQNFKQIHRKYQELESIVAKEQRENEQVRILNFKLIEQVQDFRHKYQSKSEDVIHIKNQKADIEISLKQAISKQGNLVQQITKLQQIIQEKDSQIQILNEKITELQSAVRDNIKSNNTLNVSNQKYQDMKSSNVTKFDKSRVKNDMSASRMKKSTAKQMEKSVKFKQNQVQNRFAISQAQSLRGTQIKQNLEDDQEYQQNLPKITIPQQILRQRMFTLHQQQQQHEGGSGYHKYNKSNQHDSSDVHIEVDQLQSDQLQSQVSARERQFQTFNPKKKESQSGQMSQSLVNGEPRWRNAESQSQSFINLKNYEDKIGELQAQNQRLKKQLEQKIAECNEYRQQNLLKSALGLTSGIFISQNQRKKSEQIKIQDRKNSNRSPSPHYSSKQSSPEASRQGSIYNASQNPNEKSQLLVTNLNLNKKTSIARSSVESKQRRGSADTDRNNIKQIQQRNRDLQLQLQEMSNQNQQLKNMYEEQKQNVDKIYSQLQKMVQTEQQLRNQLQIKTQEAQQIQTYYEDVKSQMQKKLQELIQQQLEKQTSQLNALKQLNKKEQTISSLQKKILQLQQKIKQQKQLFNIKQAQIQKMKEQYRKYQEQSELQILNLKQLVDYQVKQLNQKTKQVQLIAEDYYQLKDEIKLLQIDSMNKDVLIQKYRNSSEEAKDQLNKTFDNYKNVDKSRMELNLKHVKLQEQLALKQNEISQIAKKSVMTIKKFQIRIQTYQQQKLALQQKISQKDQMNQTLKQQIALYNSQTYQLKQLNNQLTLQIEKTQRQLKDIMTSYEKEFSSVSHEKNELDEALNYYKTLSKQKDEEITNLNKKIHKLQEDYRYANHEVIQVKQNYEKYKNSKQKEINDHYLELQLKTDEYQKLKKIHQRQSEQNFTKQSQYLSKIEQFTRSSKQYKQKLKKYQQTLEQLQKQLIKLSQRPTKQQYQQLQFQSQLFKNRIQQLQQHLKDTVNNANHQQQYYSEFRKYKTHKQRQLNDLQNELQKYSAKFSQLQQNNYHLKKQIQKLRYQIQKLVQQKDIITQENYELKQDLQEIKGEMEFYKGRRIQNLSKLLNDTM